MIVASIVLFGLAALGGVYLAIQHLQGARPPFGLGIVHGLIAAAALVLLLLAVVKGSPGSLVVYALGLFIVVALGGFGLFYYRVQDRSLPQGLVYVHGGAAVVAYLMLLYGHYG